MDTTYDMLEFARDTVQGLVVGKGISFDDAVFYLLATMSDSEVCTLCDEARHCARIAENDSEMADWKRVAGLCNTVLNTRHGAKVREDYDRMLDDEQHMKGIQL
jgi:hypothetical protein